MDRDEATRARLTVINERLTELNQEFSRNIRDDVRTVRVTPDRLAGLPEDWLAAHPAGDDGLVTVTTDYPDAVPVRMFAHDAGVRRERHRRLPRPRVAAERRRCCTRCSRCVTSSPDWSATTTGRRTTPT